MANRTARKGLADIGYVLAAGQPALSGSGGELIADPQVGRLLLAR